ncbi:MAG: hypothetical protein R3B90_03285 [Planctomycetaceae bacterium]
MVRLLGMALLGLLIFAATAGGVRYWQQQQLAAAAAEADAGEAPAADPTAVQAPASPASPASAAPPTAAPQPARLPVAVRSRPMSIEELTRLGLGLNERERRLDERERALEDRELRAKIALTDLESERAAIDGLRAKIQSQLEAADAALVKIEAARAQFADEQKQASEKALNSQASQIQIDDQERANLKQSATWLQSMEPSKAAEVIREMANDGRMDNAVKLLAQLEDRDVAQILSALDDAAIVDELIDRFQDLKRPEKQQAARR